MIEAFGAILKLIVFILPLLLEAFFSKGAKTRRADEDFDKALAETDAAAITRLLSQRYDSVRGKTDSNP
ncbi:MAG: hypothetical protein Q8M92_00510 [Candidatus Subteraquimicrobiales bacterium]|nr:hypothetical protein [Candidatus Subteraquimicrobiales bacterium]